MSVPVNTQVPKYVQDMIKKGLKCRAEGDIVGFIDSHVQVAEMYESLGMFENAATHYDFAGWKANDPSLKKHAQRCKDLADRPPIRKVRRIM